MNPSTIVKLVLAASVVLLGALSFGGAQAADEAVVKLQGLRNGTPVSQDNPPTASHQERDRAPAPRDYMQQPPLIPHSTAGYQITKNFNKCMDCHAWAKTATTGATKVGITHFRNRDGQELDNVSPRRYFCTQCHVAQTDAKPLVDNTFQRAKGMQ